VLSAVTKKSASSTNVLVTLGANGVISLLGLATGMLSARLLRSQGRGELAATQMWGELYRISRNFGPP
jgi:hypothetical protein